MAIVNSAMVKLIEDLPETSYFNIYSFGTNFAWLFGNSALASPYNKNLAITNVNSMTSLMGLTYIYLPLSNQIYSIKLFLI